MIVIDENGNQDKSPNCKLKGYSLFVSQKESRLTLFKDFNEVDEFTNIKSVFGDSTCSVFKIGNKTYVIYK